MAMGLKKIFKKIFKKNSSVNKFKLSRPLKIGIFGAGAQATLLAEQVISAGAKIEVINDIKIDLINVGSGEEVSIIELAEKIKNIVGFEGDLSFDNSKPDGNPRKFLDSKLINDLGWKSKISLDEGLKLTYECYKENN